MCIFCCYARLINGTNARIELAEIFLFSQPGSHACIIEIPPSGRCYHPAAMFSSRNRHTGRPSIISIRVNGVKAPRTLRPEHFKTYIRLRFEVDSDGVLQVRGVKATFSDHLQLWEMWNNIDEAATQEFRHNYKELTQIIYKKEKQIQFLETKALNLSMFYVASQLALFLVSNSKQQYCRHYSWKPFFISLSVAVAFGLNFATTIRNYVRTKYEQERNYMDQEENFHQMARLERSAGKDGFRIDDHHHEVRPYACAVYQRYAHISLTVSALLAITALVLHACTQDCKLASS